MAYVRKIKGSLVRVDSSQYVGEESYLFYDIDTGCIRITDGTPGGRPACIEGTAGSVSWGSITGNLSDQTDLQQALDALQYTLPVATNTQLGGVRSGGDITVDPTGLVTVNGLSGSTQLDTVINPGQTETVYTFDLNTIISAKFMIAITNSSNTLSHSSEIHLLVDKNAFNKYSILGDGISYAVNTAVVGSLLEVQVTNNETFVLHAGVAEIKTIRKTQAPQG